MSFSPFVKFSFSPTQKRSMLRCLLLVTMLGFSVTASASLTVPPTLYAMGDTALATLHWNCNTNQCNVQERQSTGWVTVRTSSGGDQRTSFNLNLGLHRFRLERCTISQQGNTVYCSQEAAQTVEVKRFPTVPTLTAPAEDGDGSFDVKVSEVLDATAYKVALQINGGEWQSPVTYDTAPTLNEVRPNGVYGYRAQACNAGGCSEFSEPLSVQVAIPQAPVDGSGEDNGNAPFGSLPPAGPVPSAPVGTLTGQFRVTEAGAATYTIPLSLPGGAAGVTPVLSLHYSSQGGNGQLGHGWSLGGLSAIARCRQTLSQDGRARPITWTDEDRFCLDGQRLMLASGSHYGAVGATYKTEIDSFVTVSAHGGDSGRPAYFTVTAKDGSVSTFGGTEDAHLLINGQTLHWALSRLEDSVSNRADFYYTGDADSGHSIARIEYAYPSTSSSTNPGAIVEFHYEDRADRSSSYIGGYALQQTQRLAGVTVKNAGAGSLEEYRSYNLEYQPDTEVATDDVSRLSSLEECVISRCFEKTRFDWTEAVQQISANTRGGSRSLGDAFNVLSFQPIDINGDGRIDLVWLEYRDSSPDKQQLSFALAGSDGSYFTQTTAIDGEFNSALSGESGGIDLQVMDYNGDGRQDVVVQQKDRGAGPVLFVSTPVNGSWRLARATDVEMPFTKPSVRFGDLNSNGMPDAHYLENNRLRVHYLNKTQDNFESAQLHYRYDASPRSFAFRGLPTSGADDFWKIHEIVPGGAGDFNGDGRMDLVVVAEHYTIELHTNATEPRPVGQGRQRMAFVFADDGLDYFGEIGQGAGRPPGMPIRVVDSNLDGLTDVLFYRDDLWKMSLSTGQSWAPAVVVEGLPENLPEKDLMIADINRDGYPDLLRISESDGLLVHRFLPAHQKFSNGYTQFSNAVYGSARHTTLDIDGDGWQDIVQFSDESSDWSTILSDHRGDLPLNLITHITDGLSNIIEVDYQLLTGRGGHYSRVDVGTVATESLQEVCVPDARDPVHLPKVCHTPKVHTLNTDNFYLAINDPFSDLPEGNERLDHSDSPVLEIYSPMPVVTQTATSAPISGSPGAQAKVSYYYDQMKFQAGGRGALGFRRLTTVEHQTGTVTETVYRQDWPFIGSPLETVVKSSHGHTLSHARSTWGLKTFTAEDGTQVLQPFMKQSVEEGFDLSANGEVQGAQLMRTTTTNAFDDYGNLEQLTTLTEGNGEAITKTVENEYRDEWHRAFGRLTKTTVTTTRGAETDIRRSAFAYIPAGPLRGLLLSETVEPETFFELTTTYSYDDFGNKVSALQEAADGSARQGDTTAFEAGRYVASVTNALGHITQQIVARNLFGAPTSIKDINGVTTTIHYDDMGLEYLRQDETGAWSWSGSQYCGGSVPCPEGARYRLEEKVAGGGQGFTYYDGLGRTIRQTTIGFDGTPAHIDTEYDLAGQVKRVSTAYFEGTAPAGWTVNNYDILGRVVATVLPDGTSGGTNHHEGYTTISTNALGHTQTEVRDLAGQLVRVTDNLGGNAIHQYDLSGNLVSASTSAPDAGPVTVRMCYDKLGRKVAMHDPDKGGFLGNADAPCDEVASGNLAGWWYYRYNGLGDLTSRTDPKLQTQSMDYDELGRMLTRTYQRGTSRLLNHTRWYYDGDMEGKALPGDLGNVTFVVQGRGVSTECGGSNHCTSYLHDALGRVTDTITHLPRAETSFSSGVQYDAIGRPYRQHDALSGLVSPESGTLQHYNEYGYKSHITDLASGDLLYKIHETNARAQVVEEERGNGVVTRHQYDPYFGRLENQNASVVGLVPVQDITYEWDAIGNLTSRHNQSANSSGVQKDLQESFCYDGLNRLIKSHLGTLIASCSLSSANQDVEYDGLGNISRKEGMGSYAYGEMAGPHAVTSAGGATYTYDHNGNMTSGDGRTIFYDLDDQVVGVQKDGNTTGFVYAPDGSRFMRTDRRNGQVTTTQYLGSVERVHLHGTNTITWRRSVAGALFTITTDLDNKMLGDAQKVFIFKDHLGSTDVITDKAGTVIEAQSFDAWGQRRNSTTWDAFSSSELLAFKATHTPRGFTSHEHVEDMGLVHMNGRVYDPKLARFLQADPFIQAAAHTQSYNRYSYLWNNPLNATDPSGFFLKKLWDEVRPVVGAIVGVGLALYCQGCGLLAYTIIGGVSGAVGAAANGGNILKSAALGALTGFSAGAVGWAGGAIASGFSAAVSGQHVGRAFLAAGIGGLMGGGQGAFGFVRAAVAGGLATQITGGKFKNGAATAAFFWALRAGVSQYGRGTPDNVDPHTLRRTNLDVRVTTSEADKNGTITKTISITGKYVDDIGGVGDQFEKVIESGWSGEYLDESSNIRYLLSTDIAPLGNDVSSLMKGADFNIKYGSCSLNYACANADSFIIAGGPKTLFKVMNDPVAILHEFGHILGFNHYSNPTGNVMSYAGSAITVDNIKLLEKYHGAR